jgi:hypothetical protein
MVCHLCGGPIWLRLEGWDASHPVADAFGGKVVLPAHTKCHKRQTATFDLPAIAKRKRVIEKHLGIKPKGWNTKLRKKLNGDVVPR